MWFVVMLAGALLVALALWDIFQTLFHPAGRGALSDWITAAVWRVMRATGRISPLMIAGPLGVVAVIFAWLALIVLGFSLLYWPHYAAEIAFAPAMDPAHHHSFLDSPNLSQRAPITLGGHTNAQTLSLRRSIGV